MIGSLLASQGGLLAGGVVPGWLSGLPVAHAGLHSGDERVPENSLAAVEAAAAAGWAVEVDVHVTIDRSVVCFHDRSLERMCGQRGSITGLRRSRLRQLQLLGSSEHPPLLSEVLALVDGRVPVLVEVKSRPDRRRACRWVVPAVQRVLLSYARQHPGGVAAMSFDRRVCRGLSKRLNSGSAGGGSEVVPVGLLAGGGSGWWRKLGRGLWLRRWCGASFVAFNVGLLPDRRVAGLRRRGVPVLGWTVKTLEVQQQVESLVDNIIFEHHTHLSGDQMPPRLAVPQRWDTY